MTSVEPTEDAALPFARLPALTPAPAAGPLTGTRVLDLTGSVAGPYATMLLGDLGADVLKVERPPAGDDARAWGPPFLDGDSLWFLAVNRNKRSLTLDWQHPEGAAVLHALIARADVIVVNQPPGVLRKRGIDPGRMRAAHPRLIYVAITGFGLTGMRAEHTCYDLIAEGYSGVMDLTGEPEGEPQKVGTPAADMLAGQDAAMATLAALLARGRSGTGCTIDIALVDSMTRFLSCRIVPYLGSGEVPRRTSGKDSVIAVYQAFETADDPMTLGLGNDAIWNRFWHAVGRPNYATRPELATNADRRAARTRIVADIAALLRTRPRSHWLGLCAAARVPAGPINRVDEVAADAELHARGLLYRLVADGRSIPQVGMGIRFDDAAAIPHRAPPRLGADGAAALADWLGYDAAAVAALRAQAII